MGWKYDSINRFVRDVQSIQNQRSVRDQFMAGFMKSSLAYGLIPNTFNVDAEEIGYYDFAQQCNEVLSGIPTLRSCGYDTNIINTAETDEDRTYLPFQLGAAIKACMNKCGKQDLDEYISKREYAAGVAFASKAFDPAFWYGMPSRGQRGITQAEGTHLIDMAGTGYSNFATADATKLANAFNHMTKDMIQPIVVMGGSTHELVGLRQGSNDSSCKSCDDIWDQMLTKLASRDTNLSADSFIYDDRFDSIEGIDPNNPNDVHSVMWIYDRAEIEMGLQDAELVGDVIQQGSTEVYSERALFMSTPIIKRSRASRWVFNFVDHADVQALQDPSLDQCDNELVLTVPTPIIA